MTTVLEHTYRPRGACIDLFNYRGLEVLISGPAGTGKSRACMEKVHRMCLMPSNAGMRALFLRKIHADLMASGLVTYKEKVAAESLQAGHVKWYGGSRQEPAAYKFTNGSTIVVGGLDRADKIMSTEYDLIYVQEAHELTENDWEKATTRLRNNVVSFQQLIADTNPQGPMHWLKQRCDKGQTKMLYAKHTDNPAYVNDDGSFTAIGEQYINENLAKKTGINYSRLFLGNWVAAEGQIWDGFDDSKHLIDRKDLPNGWVPWEWQRVWSIDFGHTNPMVVQRWAIDPDGRMILYGEHYQTKRLVEDVAAEHKKLVTQQPGQKRAREPRPAWIVADHDAGERASWERHFGMSTLAAKKNVKEGLEAVASRLKIPDDGKPRLMIVRGARDVRDQALDDAKKPTCTAEEISSYVWADKATKEEPVKVDDHGCDALRYTVAQLDVGGRPRMRVMSY